MANEDEKEQLSSSRIHKATEFDSLLKKIGDFSKFQYIQWLLLFIAIIPQSWYTYAPAFAARKVDETQMLCTNKINVTGKAICKDNIWQKKDYCGEVKYSPDFTSVATDWDIICEDAKKYIPLTKTIFYAGKLVGAYLFGWISDRFGRRVTLLSTMFIQFVTSLIQSFSVNFTMYVILRVPLGICSGGTLIAAFALMAEMVCPNRRNFANVLVQSSYGVGIALQALLGYLVRDWMPFNLTMTVPNVLFVLYFCFVPESPRWLAARGRTKEAEAILKKIATTNGHVYEEGILEQLQSSTKKEEATRTYHFWHLFSTKYLTKITIIEGWSWLVVSGVYYGLSFNSGNLSGDYYVNYAASGLVEIPAYIIAGILVDKINRRIPLIAYFILGGLSLLCIVPIQALGRHNELSALVMVLALIGKFTISAAYFQVYIHAAELYPTVIRTAGVGFASLCGRIGGMAAPYVVDSTPLIYPAIIFGIASMTAGIITFFLPETKGIPLPDYIHEDESKDITLKVDDKDEKDQTTAF